MRQYAGAATPAISCRSEMRLVESSTPGAGGATIGLGLCGGRLIPGDGSMWPVVQEADPCRLGDV